MAGGENRCPRQGVQYTGAAATAAAAAEGDNRQIIRNRAHQRKERQREGHDIILVFEQDQAIARKIRENSAVGCSAPFGKTRRCSHEGVEGNES